MPTHDVFCSGHFTGCLQAIFDDSFTILSASPHVLLRLNLAHPGTSPEDEGPPSRLFHLLVTLPQVGLQHFLTAVSLLD